MKTSNKILLTLFGLACISIISLVVAAKANDIPVEERTSKAFDEGTILGNRKVVSEPRTVQPFKYLVVEDFLHVELVEGTMGQIELNGEENIIPFIEIKEEGDTLKVGIDQTKSFNSTKPLTAVVRVDTGLQIIRQVGNGYIANVGELNLGNIRLDNHSYGGRMELNLSANTIRVSHIGDSSIDLAGTAESVDFQGIGSGSFQSKNLQARNVSIDLNGSIYFEVNASDKLSLNCRGSGQIKYRGNPAEIEKTLVGSFRLREID